MIFEEEKIYSFLSEKVESLELGLDLSQTLGARMVWLGSSFCGAFGLDHFGSRSSDVRALSTAWFEVGALRLV